MGNYSKQFADAFEVRTRENGSTFTCLKDDAPEWARDIVQNAHDGAFPCDWRYSMLHSIAIDVAEALSNGYEIDSTEWADCAASVYTHDLMQWAANVSNAIDAIEDARTEWGLSGGNFLEWVRAGQVYMLDQMVYFVQAELLEMSECEGAA